MDDVKCNELMVGDYSGVESKYDDVMKQTIVIMEKISEKVNMDRTPITERQQRAEAANRRYMEKYPSSLSSLSSNSTETPPKITPFKPFDPSNIHGIHDLKPSPSSNTSPSSSIIYNTETSRSPRSGNRGGTTIRIRRKKTGGKNLRKKTRRCKPIKTTNTRRRAKTYCRKRSNGKQRKYTIKMR